jgi:hypothetical protein
MTSDNSRVPEISYNEIADVLSRTAASDNAAVRLADEFQKTDPQFSRALFLLAAGVSSRGVVR